MQDITNRDAVDDFTNTCMLVSDSDEVRNQLDSKKLEYPTLVELAEDNLSRKHLDMSRYLTYNQYETYKAMLEDRRDTLVLQKQALDEMDAASHRPKYRVVNGQVILIDAKTLDDLNSVQRQNNDVEYSPQEYVRKYWDITSEYQLLPIPNCMLRGMLDSKNGKFSQVNELVAEKTQNLTVNLTQENVPPHMHHSSVTTGGDFSTMHGDQRGGTSYFTKGNTIYDMFYNDSMDVGLSRNELDGTVDKFTVNQCGSNDSISHDNMPVYRAFYGFVVQKTTGQN